MDLAYCGASVWISCVMCVTGAHSSVASDRAIPETKDFRSDSMFHFTASPNDRWLVFFKRITPEEASTRHWSLGNLRILDLKTGHLHSFALAEGETPESLEQGDASWSPDSSYCALPPPQVVDWEPERGILIDLRDPSTLHVVTTQVQHGQDHRIQVEKQRSEVPKQFSCSDCSPRLNDVELMKKHIDAKHLKWNEMPINPNADAAQIVSPDGTKIYFQKGHHTDETILFELDIATGKERQLASHKADCATISCLRPSPDGKKLAYQFGTGCGFVGMPQVFVLDLQTGENENIALASGGTMHWTSTSDRLFFYRENYLHVAEFGPAQPAKPPAASNPAPQPSMPATHPNRP